MVPNLQSNEIYTELIEDSDESVNGLFGNKVQVIQATRGYRVSEDALILAWFSSPREREFILDAGTGCGARTGSARPTSAGMPR